MLRLTFALTLLSAPLWADDEPLTIAEEFAEICGTYGEDPEALIARDLMRGNTSSGAMTADRAVTAYNGSGSGNYRQIFLTLNRYEGGYTAYCQVSLLISTEPKGSARTKSSKRSSR